MRLRRSSSAFESDESAFLDAVSPARTAGAEASGGFAGFASTDGDGDGGFGEAVWARIVEGICGIEHKTIARPTTRVAQRQRESVAGLLGGHWGGRSCTERGSGTITPSARETLGLISATRRRSARSELDLRNGDDCAEDEGENRVPPDLAESDRLFRGGRYTQLSS